MRWIAAIFGMFAMLAAVPSVAASNSADAKHLRVQLVFPQTQLSASAPNKAGLYFKLEQGWHVYWLNAGDSGEPPHVKWTLPEGVAAGPLQFPAPTRLPLGPLMDFGYEDEVLFPLSIVVDQTAKPGPAVLQAKVDWLVCREVCIPGKADLEENVQIGGTGGSANPDDQAIWDRLVNRLPESLPSSAKAVFQPTANGFQLAIETGQRETQAAFFPADQEILENPAPQAVIPTAKGIVLDLKKDVNLSTTPAQLKGIIELSAGRSYEIAATQGTVTLPAPRPPLGMILQTSGLAFLGGLLLNLMPCVFPVLFIKGLALVQSSGEERNKLRVHGFIYTAGILASFWILVGVLLGLRAAGSTLGWGFQFQSPVFLAIMAGLLFFLGLSLAGQFEIGLTLTGAGNSLAAKQGYAGSFFTGVLAVIVATPCTAPFMGTAVGFALAQPAVVTFAIFTALAIGLAAPYLALTFQPAWTRLLPRPGAWMEVLRQAVSVPIFATVIWLAWVLAGAYGATALAALLACFLLLAIAGWFLGRWPAKRWSTGVAALLIVGVIGLSIYERQLAINGEAAVPASTSPSSIALTWQPWSTDAVQRALASGKPVFVDFTANWCLSCQVNERVALTRPEVLQAFQSKNVVLLKADWTREDPAITEELTTLGRSGVPVYALYSPGQNIPQLLPQVLTPGIVTDALAPLPQTQRAGGE
jgi:thiol:disulfide interchange protein DsbD